MKNKIDLKTVADKVPELGRQAFHSLGGVVKRMDRSQISVVAAVTVAGGACLLRLGFTEGAQGRLISLGLLVVDLGIVLHLHIAAKAYWERFEAWRERCEGREQKQRLFIAAEKELQANQEALEKVTAEIDLIEDELKLRARLNFDVKQISMAAAAAVREGYLFGVDGNKGGYTA